MSADLIRKDLILLVADKNMEASLKGLLSRFRSLKFRQVAFDLYVHPERDPGCLLRAHDFLRPFVSRYERALVLLDHVGCGQESEECSKLEANLEKRLGDSGWEGRAAAVVIAPELENWVWSDSPKVDIALGWEGKTPPLRDWLVEKGLLQAGVAKPSEPKRAVELTLKTVRTPRSSAIYFELAQGVSMDRCTDPAFAKLRRCLREWFPVL
jgi:hypothetical protein